MGKKLKQTPAQCAQVMAALARLNLDLEAFRVRMTNAGSPLHELGHEHRQMLSIAINDLIDSVGYSPVLSGVWDAAHRGRKNFRSIQYPLVFLEKLDRHLHKAVKPCDMFDSWMRRERRGENEK